MVRRQLRSKYATVKIPSELAEKLDRFVPDMGYRSRAEIVNDAIRRFIDDKKRLNYQTEEGSKETGSQRKREVVPELTH